MGESSSGHSVAVPLQIAEHPEAGVNVVGFFEIESGVGEMARRLVAAVESTGSPISAIPYRGTLGRNLHPHGLSLANEAPYDTNLVCLSADDLRKFALEAGSAFFAKRYSIGVWFWETDVFRSADRSDRAAVRFLDELWVASDYVRESLAREVDIPVHVVPFPVEPPRGPFRTRSELGLPDAFTFLFVFDYWSGERKNPVGVVNAFVKAFEPGEGPVLVLKSVHGRDWKPRQFDSVAAVAGGREDIVFRDGYVSAEERDSYVSACDCYISLHRSEGLGLTMAEALACAKPVIATGYSGNLEFMSERNSLLVPYRLVNVPESWWAHAPGATWAEPDIDAAAALMRRVWEHRDEAHALGLAARDEILESFPPVRTAAFVSRRLNDARARGAVSARASAHDSRPAILEATRLLAAKGLGDSLTRPGPRPVSLVRRLAQRALWPYLEDERRFDLAVLDALTALHRSVEALERRVLKLEGLGVSGPSAPPGEPPVTSERPSEARSKT
jgi:glycosyltransferase involved in cell wall biosynthesis